MHIYRFFPWRSQESKKRSRKGRTVLCIVEQIRTQYSIDLVIVPLRRWQNFGVYIDDVIEDCTPAQECISHSKAQQGLHTILVRCVHGMCSMCIMYITCWIICAVCTVCTICKTCTVRPVCIAPYVQYVKCAQCLQHVIMNCTVY